MPTPVSFRDRYQSLNNSLDSKQLVTTSLESQKKYGFCVRALKLLVSLITLGLVDPYRHIRVEKVMLAIFEDCKTNRAELNTPDTKALVLSVLTKLGAKNPKKFGDIQNLYSSAVNGLGGTLMPITFQTPPPPSNNTTPPPPPPRNLGPNGQLLLNRRNTTTSNGSNPTNQPNNTTPPPPPMNLGSNGQLQLNRQNSTTNATASTVANPLTNATNTTTTNSSTPTGSTIQPTGPTNIAAQAMLQRTRLRKTTSTPTSTTPTTPTTPSTTRITPPNPTTPTQTNQTPTGPFSIEV